MWFQGYQFRLCNCKKKRISYPKRLISLNHNDTDLTDKLDARNTQYIAYTLASEDNKIKRGIEFSDGVPSIEAPEEDLATFSMNYPDKSGLYWGSSKDEAEKSYSYRLSNDSTALNITGGEVKESLDIQAMNRVNYIFFNNRPYVNNKPDPYNLDVTVSCNYWVEYIKQENVATQFLNISKNLENHLCIDTTLTPVDTLYLQHGQDEIKAEIPFNVPENMTDKVDFYFDANTLLYAEPFKTANFSKYLLYYKGEPKYSEIYKWLRLGFDRPYKAFDVLPVGADTDETITDYAVRMVPLVEAKQANVKVSGLSGLRNIVFDGADFSKYEIELPSEKEVSITINAGKPASYTNVKNIKALILNVPVGDIYVADSGVISIDTIYLYDGVGSKDNVIDIQQEVTDTSNQLYKKIKELNVTGGKLTSIQGTLKNPIDMTLGVQVLNSSMTAPTLLSIIDKIKTLDMSGSTFTELPAYTLSGAVILEKLVLPDTLTSIGQNAIANTSLKEVHIPDSVTTIGTNALNGIDKVYYKGTATDANNWGAKEIIKE